MNRRTYGLRAWIVQRLSAVYVALFALFFFFHWLTDAPQSYSDWHGWVTGRAVSVAMALFFAALLMHAWIGLRDVIMDYMRSLGLRLSFLVLIALLLLATGFWVLRILFQVA